MTHILTIWSKSILQSKQAGKTIAKFIKEGDVVYITGDIGSGKTTLAKGIIEALGGYQQQVKSPTYSIMEEHRLENLIIYHCDLYRLKHPEEVLGMGLDMLSAHRSTVLLVEWPEKGLPFIPKAAHEITVLYSNNVRKILYSNTNLEILSKNEKSCKKII